MRYTKVIQTREVNGKPVSGQLVFANSKSATVTKLKRLWPLPSEFFYVLNKTGAATYTDPNDGTVNTVSVFEFDPKDEAKTA